MKAIKPLNAIQEDLKKKEDRPDRTIETMFRITSANSQRLSDQADTKSHIMISVNAIILSVLLTMMISKLQEYPHLMVPFILLISVNILTIVFSSLATRPNIPKGSCTQDELKQKNVNLLFFGNFYKMKFEDYCLGMMDVMKERNFLYQSLLRDIYCQGVVLGKKYRMLKMAYHVFMFGLILAVAVFVGSALVGGKML